MALATAPTLARVTRLARTEDLAAPREAWNALAGQIPFRRWEWLEAWWRHYREPHHALCTLLVHDDEGRLIGVAPWYLEATWKAGRVLRPLGTGEVCSDYLGLLVAEGCREPVARALADWLDGPEAPRWDWLDLHGVAADDQDTAAFSDELARRGHPRHQLQRERTWPAALGATWDAHLATLSRSRREKIRQLWRREFGAGSSVVRTVETPAELDEGFRILVDLHQRRRHALGQPGCFTSPRYTAFHREVMERFLALGRLRLQRIERHGQPIATEYDLLGDDTVYYYQTGLDPAAEADRPGWLQVLASLKRAIEEGYTTFDFLRGDEPYKASWGGAARPLVEVRIAARRPLARARLALWVGLREVRDRARQVAARLRAKFQRSPEPAAGAVSAAAPTGPAPAPTSAPE